MLQPMELEEKFDWLGQAAQGDVACRTCAVNPRASLVTHRATQPLTLANHSGASPARPTQAARDLEPWLTRLVRSDGKQISVVKTIVVQSASCQYN